ncbi:hypothetical protein J2X69_000425 [Algoriphagus sp. 4150]|nr:hypothetical protein [Algoriphagus sp. 4150]
MCVQGFLLLKLKFNYFPNPVKKIDKDLRHLPIQLNPFRFKKSKPFADNAGKEAVKTMPQILNPKSWQGIKRGLTKG